MHRRPLFLVSPLFLISLFLAMTAAAGADPLPTVSIHADNINAAQLMKMIHDQTGADLAYLPVEDTVVSIHVENVGLSEVVSLLAKRGGTVALRGPNDRLTVSAKGIRASDLAALVARMTGGQVAFAPADPNQTLSFDAKDVSVLALPHVLAPFGEAKIIPLRR